MGPYSTWFRVGANEASVVYILFAKLICKCRQVILTWFYFLGLRNGPQMLNWTKILCLLFLDEVLALRTYLA